MHVAVFPQRVVHVPMSATACAPLPSPLWPVHVPAEARELAKLAALGVGVDHISVAARAAKRV